MQWQYKIIAQELRPGVDVEKTLNDMGAQGWRAVATEFLLNNHLWIFFERSRADHSEYVSEGAA